MFAPKTIWMKTHGNQALLHALHADGFLHFTNSRDTPYIKGDESNNTSWLQYSRYPELCLHDLVSEWGPAFDVESIVFRSHGCIQSKPLPADAKRTYHDFGYLPESEMVLLKQPFV